MKRLVEPFNGAKLRKAVDGCVSSFLYNPDGLQAAVIELTEVCDRIVARRPDAAAILNKAVADVGERKCAAERAMVRGSNSAALAVLRQAAVQAERTIVGADDSAPVVASGAGLPGRDLRGQNINGVLGFGA